MADIDINAQFKRRLDAIVNQGTMATQYARDQEYARRQAEMASQQQGYNNSLNQFSQNPQYSPPATPANMPRGSKNFESFVNAITGQESGGNYRAVNSSSGALGRYQIMPGNVAGWSREALGRSVSPSQFLNSPDIQNRVARYKLQQYYNMYGPAGAAVAWYAGPGTAKRYVANNGQGFGARQGNYPSIANYASSILRRMGY